MDHADATAATKVVRVDEDAGLALVQQCKKSTVWVPLSALVEVKPSKHHGLGLHATAQIPAGAAILQEDAVLLAAEETCVSAELQAVNDACARARGTISVESLLPAVAFCKLDRAARIHVLQLYCPTLEQADAALVRGYGEALEALMPSLSRVLGLEELPSRADVLRCLLICDANAFQVEGHDGAPLGQALYPTAARANHSCLPNAWWHIASTPGTNDRRRSNRVTLRALTVIEAGCEVTQCYLGEERWGPRGARRAALLRAKGFLCRCERCTAPYDDARGFACPCCADGTVYLTDSDTCAPADSSSSSSSAQPPSTCASGVASTSVHAAAANGSSSSASVVDATAGGNAAISASRCAACEALPPRDFVSAATRLEASLARSIHAASACFGSAQCTATLGALLRLLSPPPLPPRRRGNDERCHHDAASSSAVPACATGCSTASVATSGDAAQRTDGAVSASCAGTGEQSQVLSVDDVGVVGPRPTRHHLAAAALDLAHDAAKADGQFVTAARCMRARVAAARAVYTRPSNAVAWLQEHLGDALAAAAGAPLRMVLDDEYATALEQRSAAAAAAGADMKRNTGTSPFADDGADSDWPSVDLWADALAAYANAVTGLEFAYGVHSAHPAIAALRDKIDRVRRFCSRQGLRA
eukprot:TRINITY_DN2279_c0_g1_i1.p1 TRINITY_DN2279_c0_g1~~TRINITY_DN2279_c0_g1_i1.p1  ORF type:complete len:649 (-),score=169.56 TRINITY_DN2279_c0_g1_i1:355-2301(-)